ncbi:hypothetical protein F4806DRAFT_52649 [Annulohypoxylon nitens]|nr:hypothetical protein F4806DRAFT_52649 [Annulohypoxylon nitens]
MNKLSKEPHQAMRAILSQLLYKNSGDRRLVDAASILMDVTGSGQRTASESEVISLLELFFDWYPTTALVFDGVDECSNPRMFLNKLYTLCSSSQCKILLFNRPNLTLPPIIQHTCQVYNLRRGANHHDIHSFVQPRLEDLVTSCLLPAIDVGSTAHQIAVRSNSLFLWAKLMMDFLDCPALSQSERMNAIAHLYMLEGLEPLFIEILKMIKQKFRQEINAAYMAFSWILVANRPLKLLELQAGLAIKHDRRTLPESDYIADFRRSIVRICGALIEIRDDLTIRFIHLSVRDFFTSSSTSIPTDSRSLRIPLPIAQIMMSSLCLSYIIHNVPQGPLSGSRVEEVHLPSIKSKLPFLSHAIDWPDHIAGALEATNRFPSLSSKSSRVFSVITQNFLNNKPAMTIWLESVWAFGTTPRISEASKSLDTWLKEAQKDISTKYYTQITRIGEKLGSLAADLAYLRREWNHVLSQNPGEIWAPSIHIFYKSSSLVGTTEGSLNSIPRASGCGISANRCDENLCYPDIQEKQLLTQVSEDGTSFISVSLIPGKKYLEHKEAFLDRGTYDYGYLQNGCKCRGQLCVKNAYDIIPAAISSTNMHLSPAHLRNKAKMADSRCLSICYGWKAHIQYQPTGSSSPETRHHKDIFVCLPPEQIFHMLMMTFYIGYKGKDAYIIPVAASQDLSTVSLLHSVIKLTPNYYIFQGLQPSRIKNANKFFLEGPLSTIGSMAPEAQYKEIQYLSEDLCIFTRNFMSFGLKYASSRFLSTMNPDSELWMKMTLSRDGRYLAIVRPSLGFQSYTYLKVTLIADDPPNYDYCSIVVFENMGTSTNTPSQLHYAEISHVSSNTRHMSVGGVNKPLVFHPSEPYLAIASEHKVLLWKFDDTASEPTSIFEGILDDMTFSMEGSTLSGNHVHHNKYTKETTKVPTSIQIDFDTWDRHMNTSHVFRNGQDDGSSRHENSFDNKESHTAESASLKADLLAMQDNTNDISFTQEKLTAKPLDNNVSSAICLSNEFHVQPKYVANSNIPDRHSQTVLSLTDGIFDTPERKMQPFAVAEDKKNGMILMEAALPDGTVKVADLLRLPKSIVEEKLYATVDSLSKRSSSMDIVLNKAVESTYAFNRQSNVNFPIVVEREKSSIDVWSTKRSLDCPDHENNAPKRLKEHE